MTLYALILFILWTSACGAGGVMIYGFTVREHGYGCLGLFACSVYVFAAILFANYANPVCLLAESL